MGDARDGVHEFRQRMHALTEDRQGLVDLHLEVQLDPALDEDELRNLEDEIEKHIERLGGWGDALPRMLESCPYCGKVRDRRPGGGLSSCLCAGILCRYCGAGRVHRPISDHYEVSDHRLWHTSHFANTRPCDSCLRLLRRLQPSAHEGENWSPTAIPPRVSAALETLRKASSALSQAEHAFDTVLRSHDLLALHGSVEVWHDLRLGSPPDGRPLYVGRSLEDVGLPPRHERLRVAIWSPDRDDWDLEETLAELLVRWQPPLNRDVATPWTTRNNG